MTTQYAIQITARDRIEINENMPVPEIGPTQILLEIEACGICFSDTKLMHAFENHPRKTPIESGLSEAELAEIPTYRPGSAPVVPGHEPVARVAKVGDEVTRFRVGQRMLVQTDYRHLPTAASNAAFGYDFDGALEEYALVDEKMVIDPHTGESYLIEVGEAPSASAVALVEPWACVETAYSWPERQGILADGSLLVVVDPGFIPQGLEELIVASQPGTRVWCSSVSSVREGEIFDDIIYVGANPDTVEALGPHLGKRGIMNIVTCGHSFSRNVAIDAGRIHYDLIRYVGTTSDRAEDGYLDTGRTPNELARSAEAKEEVEVRSTEHTWIPSVCEVRGSDRVAVIGAAGPMGLMHVVRTVTSGIPGVSVDAVDVDDERLRRLHEVVEPIAAQNGVPVTIHNSSLTPLKAGYTYIALMVPSPALLAQAVDLAGEGAIVNAFAGFAIGTMAYLDLEAMIERRIYVAGTSGSRICDMETVLRRLEAGTVDTNISLDAITGMAGVPDAIESVNNRTSQGKIMVYPKLHELGLTRLVDCAEKLPEVAKAMDGSRWTKQAEDVLLRGVNDG